MCIRDSKGTSRHRARRVSHRREGQGSLLRDGQEGGGGRARLRGPRDEAGRERGGGGEDNPREDDRRVRRE
eukprot:10074288-Alexandrium_andersonii.AAC.1